LAAWLDSRLDLQEPNSEALVNLAATPEWEELLKLVRLYRNRAFLNLLSASATVARDTLAVEARAYDKVFTLLDAFRREATGE